MKKILPLLLAAGLTAASCEDLFQSFSRQGELQIRFSETTVPGTRASALPDTNEFIITITDSNGKSIYNGTFGAMEESWMLNEGNYTVEARSCEFKTPEFDRPQYGDTQVATVKAGQKKIVTLECSQQNSGVRLRVDSGFLNAYPQSALYLKSTAGKLLYAYSEKRIAYFLPGTVSLLLADSSQEQVLFSRVLQAQQVLTLNIGVGNSASENGIKVQVDTTRNWVEDDYVIGGGDQDGGGQESDAYSVSEAKNHTGEEDVWVYGYIVGGDLSSKSCSFDPPFSSKTNLVIAAKSSCKTKSSCLSVQLPKGSIRDELNLVDNPELLGRQLFIKGDIVESYYGIPGVQNLSDYNYR